ncbi:tetratricopeptide repeat protein [Desulfocurvus vexinensis]|uniref:tetratricopeptide repeat protein n=1 Tax=Desulfocurvus vexinensis TaxID=399548 RepID=UPI00048D6D02|nr:tetratricopeptide repeat protein [Desulfocurvus vexinensis]
MRLTVFPLLCCLVLGLPLACGAARAQEPELSDAARTALHEAAQALGQGRPAQAEATLRALIAAEGDAAPGPAWHLLGNTLHALGRPAEAARAFASGLARAPDDPALHRNLGIAAYQSRDYALAAQHLERAAALAAQPDPEVLLQAAAAHHQAGQHREAVRLLEPLAAQANQDGQASAGGAGGHEGASLAAQALELLAAAALASGDGALAESAALRCLRAEPGAGRWWRLVAGVRSQRGDLAGAAAALETLVRLEPPAEKDLRTLAELYFAAGALPLGIRALERAAGPHPGPGDCDALALANHRAGRLDAALGWLDAAQAQAPDAERLLRKAAMLEVRGRAAQAADACAQALELAPGNARAWLRLGQLAREAGRPVQARQALERAATFPQTAGAARRALELLDGGAG